MGLFVLKEDSPNLMQLSFEEILNEISEKPKNLLCTHGVILLPVNHKAKPNDQDNKHDGGKPTTLYLTLKKTFSTSEGIQNIKIQNSTYSCNNMLSYHLDRLQQEFEESHSAAKLQPKENKSIIPKKKWLNNS